MSTTTYESTYNNHPIMTNPEKQQGGNELILEKIDQMLTHATQQHNKVFFMRMDLRFPQGSSCPGDNAMFSSFQEAYMRHLRRHDLDPQYVAVRECSTGKHQHYHMALVLDGNKTQSIYNHIQAAERLWGAAVGGNGSGGLVNDCTQTRNGEPQQNGIMLRRDDPEFQAKFDRCFHWASYLAKENQKGHKAKRQREVFASRIPKNNTTQQ